MPVNTVQFSSKLGDIGQLTGTIQTSDATVQTAYAVSLPWHLLCERTAVYVDLNGELVWGGLLIQAKYQRSLHQVDIICQDWWGYLLNSRIITWNAAYNGSDQLLVAADLVNIAQGKQSSDGTVPLGFVQGGNVGITLGSIAQKALNGTYTSGVAVTASWPSSAYKNVGQAISDMGTAVNGFDWTIDVAYNTNNVPTKTFNLWFPRAGRTQQQQATAGTAVSFYLGGNSAQDYLWTTGQTTPGNVLFAAGSGTGNVAVGAEAAAPELLQQGWPVLEESVSFTDISDQTLLDNVALAYLNQIMYPVAQPEIYYSCGTDSDQPLGSYSMGDDARLIIDPDDYFPLGYDSEGNQEGEEWWRIVQWTVNVNDDGKSYNDILFAVPVQVAGE